MGDTAQYVQFWFITISVANLIVIGLLIVVFIVAVVLRRPGEAHESTIVAQPSDGAGQGSDASNLEVQS